MESNLELAREIVNSLEAHTGPKHCTWGSTHPIAHQELFEEFYDSMVDDIEAILNTHDATVDVDA